MKEEKIAIITDSSSGLPAELLAKNDIQVINIPIRVGEKSIVKEQDWIRCGFRLRWQKQIKFRF